MTQKNAHNKLVHKTKIKDYCQNCLQYWHFESYLNLTTTQYVTLYEVHKKLQNESNKSSLIVPLNLLPFQ